MICITPSQKENSIIYNLNNCKPRAVPTIFEPSYFSFLFALTLLYFPHLNIKIWVRNTYTKDVTSERSLTA